MQVKDLPIALQNPLEKFFDVRKRGPSAAILFSRLSGSWVRSIVYYLLLAGWKVCRRTADRAV